MKCPLFLYIIFHTLLIEIVFLDDIIIIIIIIIISEVCCKWQLIDHILIFSVTINVRCNVDLCHSFIIGVLYMFNEMQYSATTFLTVSIINLTLYFMPCQFMRYTFFGNQHLSTLLSLKCLHYLLLYNNL